jgi:hypothetical protein
MIEEPTPGAVEERLREPLHGATRQSFQRHARAPNGVDASEKPADGEGPDPTTPSNENPLILDLIAGALEAPDPQSFLLALANALLRSAPATDGESSLGTMLRCLGDALDEELDEEQAFDDLVDALERRRFGAPGLHEAVPIVAAFLARIVSAPILRTASGATPAEIADLVHAAAQAAREALEQGGARSWCALPRIASTIAGRATQRNLSIGPLAAALPRLWARLNSRPRDATTAAAPVYLRGRMPGEPHRMVLSGPVEIVILER